jgi:hypothetical protein
MQAQKRSGSVDIFSSILDAGWKWVINAMSMPLCPPVRNRGIHCRGGWVAPRAGLEGHGEGKIYLLHRGLNPNHLARSESIF